VPGDRGERSAARRLAGALLGVGVEGEAEPRLVAHAAQESGGIVEEAHLVEDAQKPRLQVAATAEGVVQVAEVLAREPDGHGVDGEVAAAQVVHERGRLHHR
jgi:hypothetical protein